MLQLVIDYKKSSNLIRITGALIPLQCLVDFWLFNQRIAGLQLAAIYITLFLLFMLAQGVRSGRRWIRWPYLCIAALSLIFQLYDVVVIIANIAGNGLPRGNRELWGAAITDGIFVLVQDILSVYSIYLLFVPTKIPDIEDDDNLAIENALEV